MKARIIAAVFVFCFLAEGVLLAGGREGAGFIEDKYRAGKEYFRKGDYESAVKAFEEVVRLDPNYKVAAEYIKVAKSKALAAAQKKIALHERKEGLEEVEKVKEGAAKKRAEQIVKLKEGFERWQAKEKEKKRIHREKKEEKGRIKREKELARYYGMDELEDISRSAQKMIAEAEKKNILEEKQENQMWAKIEALPSPRKEKAAADVYMERAEAAYREGNYEAAFKEWEKASAAYPSDPRPQQRITALREMIGKDKKAELAKAKEESIAEAEDAVKKYCSRGGYLYHHNDYKASITEYQKALAISPGSKPASQGLLKAGRALRAEEEKIRRLISRGNVYLLGKKYSKARSLALNALELDPDSASAKDLLEKAELGLRR